MNGTIDYKPIAPELQSALVNTMRTIRTDDVVKLEVSLGLWWLLASAVYAFLEVNSSLLEIDLKLSGLHQ